MSLTRLVGAKFSILAMVKRPSALVRPIRSTRWQMESVDPEVQGVQLKEKKLLA